LTDGDTRLPDVFQPEGDFILLASEVKGYRVTDELLLEAFEMKVFTIAQ
jgi:hypothetical protein